MTEHDPSMMFPGQYEVRRSPVVPADETAAIPESPTTIPAATNDTAVARPARSAERPLWVRTAIVLGVLFAAMFVVMWGASVLGR